MPLVAGSRMRAVVGQCANTAVGVGAARTAASDVAAQSSPASAPSTNVNWFTLCPASIFCSVSEGAGSVSCAAHSLRSAPHDLTRHQEIADARVARHATAHAAAELRADARRDDGVLPAHDAGQRCVEAEPAQHGAWVDRALAAALIDARIGPKR